MGILLESFAAGTAVDDVSTVVAELEGFSAGLLVCLLTIDASGSASSDVAAKVGNGSAASAGTWGSLLLG